MSGSPVVVPTGPDAPEQPAAPIGRHTIWPFFALTYVMSWAWLITLGLAGGVVFAGAAWPTHFPALLGPMLAAFALTFLRQGRSGVMDLLRRMSRYRVPYRWWLFALSPVILVLLVLGVDLVSGIPVPAVSDFARFSGLSSQWGLLGVAAGLIVLNGFGEETGWRGFALPNLQRRFNPLVATLILASLWAGWHVPMFFVVDNFHAIRGVLVIGWVIGIVSGAVVLTWLYNRSGGSILLVAVWHGTYNIVSGTAAATGLLAASSTTLVIVLAVWLVVLEYRAAHSGRPSVLGPRD